MTPSQGPCIADTSSTTPRHACTAHCFNREAYARHSNLALAWTPGESEEALQAAYLALKLTCARGSQAANTQLDIVELRRRTSTLIAHLGQFDGLLRSAGTAAKAAEQVRDQASRLLRGELDAINTALNAA